MGSDCEDSVLYLFELRGGIAFEVIWLGLLFYSMVILTDNYLMNYLEITIKRFNLSEEGGGCLIAFGSIVPEFTVSLVSTLLVSKQHSTLGLSTIIGSGCFDFTICVGISGFTAAYYYKFLDLSIKSLLTDMVVYLCCLLLLAYFLQDATVTTLEAGFLLLLTPLYVVYTFWFRKSDKKEPEKDLEPFKTAETAESPLELPIYCIKTPINKFFGMFTLNYTGKLHQILVSYAMIIGFNFLITRGTIFMLERILCHIEVSESILGLTLISWGNNVEDILNSAISAKRGFGQLSVSCLLSIQVLNLIFCLGFPWTIATLLNGSLEIPDSSTVLSLQIPILVVTCSFLILCVVKKLNYKFGFLSVTLYIVYVVCIWVKNFDLK